MQGQPVQLTPRLGRIAYEIGKYAVDRQFLMSSTALKSVEVATTGDWAIDGNYQNSTAAWFPALGSRQGCFFPMLSRGLVTSVPFNVGIAIAAGYLPGSVRGEGLPEILQRMFFSREALAPKTAIGIAAVTQETLDAAPGGQGPLEDAVTLGVIISTDGDIHQGITGSAFPGDLVSGTTAPHLYADARAAMLSVFAPGQPTGRGFWTCSPQTAIALSTLPTTGGQLAAPDMRPDGGSLLGLPALVSPAWGEELTLFDGSQIAAGAQALAMTASRNASYDSSLNPTENAALGSNPANLISAFQSNVVLFRCITRFVFAAARENAVFNIGNASSYGS